MRGEEIQRLMLFIAGIVVGIEATLMVQKFCLHMWH
jgi:hypothetical protein